jgi:dCMP deaminase
MTNIVNSLDIWDRRFLELARQVASWSKDPSTQTGSVIVGERRRVLGLGYNGFPRGIEDLIERLEDRPTKYALIAHAERNALDNTEIPVLGATIYCTLSPCSECAKSIIQRGIKRVVAVAERPERWIENLDQAAMMFKEAGVIHDLVPGSLLENLDV